MAKDRRAAIAALRRVAGWSPERTYRIRWIVPRAVDLADPLLREARLLREAVVVLLHPAVDPAGAAEDAQRVVCHRGLGGGLIEPAGLVHSRERGLANGRC